MEVNGFLHIYTANNWKEIIINQINKMKEVGLWEKMNKLYVGIVGEEAHTVFFNEENKITVMYRSKNPILYESLTLAGLYRFAHIANTPLFYIHTKGCSKPYNSFQEDWRELMEYYIIKKYESCLRELKIRDIAGVNWHFGDGYMNAKKKTCGGVIPSPHFSGNFWWANSSYIRKLPPPIPINSRFDCEFWIGKAHPKIVELWNSGKYHHRQEYPCDLYKGKEQVKYL